MNHLHTTVERVFREEYARIIGALIADFGDPDAAEDAAQEAFVAALSHWREVVPTRPGAWLTTTARRRLIDRLRRRGTLLRALQEYEDIPESGDDSPEATVADERLNLMLLCCHPALSREAQVALTLRLCGGLTTEQIAAAFLVPVPTLAQRLVRAKRTIRTAGLPFRLPPGELPAERVEAVLAVIYLIFNEGYTASGGTTLLCPDLCEEALRLARLVAGLMPTHTEAAGLLALLLLQHSRRAARTTPDGGLVLLEDQDRALWDTGALGEGLERVDRAVASAPEPGPYLLQALIAAEHARAQTAEATSWYDIALLYDRLAACVPSPVVELNRAVAWAMACGPDVGLLLLDEMVQRTPALWNYRYFAAARADLLRRLERMDEAAAMYIAALAHTHNVAEREFLMRRLAEAGACRKNSDF